ncbi:N-acyl homoserine lactonase family protein [Pseudomonas panipatensis]|uniref:N-acyl homoserine lactone hydrolase n=1 Tax=Pseudomonas panipatensis TaxID=428992 RepID=A0A1G8FLW9_9PSED|nr:N-acyl homoserine lactonase family protein [Pseudomonas panipatensis]SDH83163.1 N-acyl homoserine lactone hydrolase [Pseudomonas panipatensis]SMP52973.1 N-acyl homoserine lactone hydrolase [Pseudomonas panipatensis]
MTQVTRLWPLLTATHRYDKSISTWQRGHGVRIEAPILAYLIETRQGRILYDVGCDYSKLHDPARRARWYDPQAFPMGAPEMTEEQRLPAHFARLGLSPADIDLVFLGHLHFDHAGGLCEVCGAEVHVHADELAAARAQADEAYFADDFAGDYRWKVQRGEYELLPGVRAIETPGHTAGHMSLLIELPKGKPVILAGDAADLQENLDQEIAPGSLWQAREDLAIASIRKLKALAGETGGELWPNHDMAFYQGLKRFPEYHS